MSQSILLKCLAKRGASNTGDCKAILRKFILILESWSILDEKFIALETYSLSFLAQSAISPISAGLSLLYCGMIVSSNNYFNVESLKFNKNWYITN